MWIDVQQNSEEWFDWRKAKGTSSKFPIIMADEGSPFGEPAKKYAEEIACEIVTGELEEKESYGNKNMADGHVFEPVARRAYEMETFNDVTHGGFFVSEDERFGDSNDGNVGEDGCIEIKCVIRTTQFKRLKKGGIDTAYKWQIHGHIWAGKKQWCDFVSYCHSMPKSKRTFICRVERDEAMIARIELRMRAFWEMVELNVVILRS